MKLDPNADKYFKGILGKTDDANYEVPSLDCGSNALFSASICYGIASKRFPAYTAWMKIGYNAEISTVEEAVWAAGGAYVFPTAEMGMEVVSTSVEDDILTGGAVAGTGVHKMMIYYLDGKYVEKQEEVTLNGQGVVATTATDIFRINGVRVTEAGTGGCAAGAISVRHLADTPLYTQIAIGHTRARTCVYTVPWNKTLYVTSLAFSSTSGAGKNTVFTTRANLNDLTGQHGTIFFPFHEVGIEDGAVSIILEIPTRLPAQTDLLVVGKGTGAAVCACALRGWLEDC